MAPVASLNSPGGLLKHGYMLGQTFMKYEVQAVVTKGQQCASACAIAFLGAKFRTIEHDGKLLFHAPYVITGATINCADSSQMQDMKGYMESFLGSKDGEYLFDRTMAFCGQSNGWTVNADATKLFGITT